MQWILFAKGYQESIKDFERVEKSNGVVEHQSGFSSARIGGVNNLPRRMKQLAAFICVLIIGAWCPVIGAVGSRSVLTCEAALVSAISMGPAKSKKERLGRARKPSKKTADKTELLTIFITGNELGALKPCGCLGGQLGGLDRRSAVFKSVPKEQRLIVDTGRLTEGDSEQGQLKFNIVVEALKLLKYDLVNLTREDIEIARNQGMLDGIGSVFKTISAQQPPDANMPATFTRKLPLNGQPIVVNVAAFDVDKEEIEQIEGLFTTEAGAQSVNILIVNGCDRALIDSIAKKAPVVDCLVCPAESDEPELIGEANRSPLVFSVGRFGKYVNELQIRAVKGEKKLKLSYRSIPVKEDLPRESSLVELYKNYQQLVKLSNLLENYPRIPLREGLKYTGSRACQNCHEYEYKKWSSRVHAHAYATLEKVGSQYDPECVVCHVVGMKYESGFVSGERSGHLKNVGCENCHGAGSEHIESAGEVRIQMPKSVCTDCTDCHTPEHSGDYAGNEALKFQKIIHWREPNPADNVKK